MSAHKAGPLGTECVWCKQGIAHHSNIPTWAEAEAIQAIEQAINVASSEYLNAYKAGGLSHAAMLSVLKAISKALHPELAEASK